MVRMRQPKEDPTAVDDFTASLLTKQWQDSKGAILPQEQNCNSSVSRKQDSSFFHGGKKRTTTQRQSFGKAHWQRRGFELRRCSHAARLWSALLPSTNSLVAYPLQVAVGATKKNNWKSYIVIYRFGKFLLFIYLIKFKTILFHFISIKIEKECITSLQIISFLVEDNLDLVWFHFAKIRC